MDQIKRNFVEKRNKKIKIRNQNTITTQAYETYYKPKFSTASMLPPKKAAEERRIRWKSADKRQWGTAFNSKKEVAMPKQQN